MLAVYKALARVRPAPVAVFLKKAFGISRRIINTSRGRFFIDPVSNFGLALQSEGEYEPEMISTIEKVLTPSSIFVDIGANEGYFSILGSRLVGEAGRVLSVEPQVRLDSILKRNFQLNDARNIILINAAISDCAGDASLFISPDTNTGSTALVNPSKYNVAKQAVRTMTLRQLFDQNGIAQADLVKMDIESFEYEAILGSPDIFKNRRIKTLALELHPHLLAKRKLDPDAITRALASWGYTLDPSFATSVYV